MSIWYVLLGIIYGIIGGMGLGGGIILIPVFTIIFGFGQHEAQAINLAVFIPMAISALILHIKNKRVRLKNISILIIAGIIGAFLGSFLSFLIKGDYLRIAFGVFLIIISVIRIYKLEYLANKNNNSSNIFL